ncbi:MAG TPA: Ldh family oxidoreductase [Methylomirabilota bacterium]|nr:Ldh family oxidoreductase [Methylomirabilota bacterium]
MAVRVPVEALREFSVRAFEAVGVPRPDAEVTADSMIQASLRGEGDHGMRLCAIWVHKIRDGGTNPLTPLEVVREAPATALLDAHDGIGAVAATRAMDMAIGKAREIGIGWVGVRNSNSCGSAKFYAMKALPHRMIGIALTNGVPLVVPPGGLDARTGTNPIAIAAPAKSEHPVVLDMATAAIAFERLRVYASRGEKIPVGWAIDREGNPVEDPSRVNEGGFLKGGALLPLGGYKGFGLSVMVNVLTGVLMGGAYMAGLSEFAPHDTPERDSFALGAINIDHFIPYEEFVERMDDLIRATKDCTLAPGVQQIYLPGERGFQRERARRQAGMPLDGPTADALRAIARELDLPPVPGL